MAEKEIKYGFVYFRAKDIFEVLQYINDIVVEEREKCWFLLFMMAKTKKQTDGSYLMNLKSKYEGNGNIFIEILKIENGVFEIELYANIPSGRQADIKICGDVANCIRKKLKNGINI